METFVNSKLDMYSPSLYAPIPILGHFNKTQVPNIHPSLQKSSPALAVNYGSIRATPPTSPETSFSVPLKRHCSSRSPSTSPGSTKSTPKRKRSSEFVHNSPKDSKKDGLSPPLLDLSLNLGSINVLNSTVFQCRKDLLVLCSQRMKVQRHLKYLLEDVLPAKRNMMPNLKIKQEHILEVLSTVNFFYKNISEEFQQNSEQLHKLLDLRNTTNGQGINIAIANLLAKSKQIVEKIETLRDLDSNMIETMANVLERILSANFKTRFEILLHQLNCWLLDLLVNILPGYVDRLMKISATSEARGIYIKECRSKKRCLTDWLTVAKSLNHGKVDLYTTINRFTAVAGVSVILQNTNKFNPIKDVFTTRFDDNVVQETYNICKGLEEVVEPLRQIQKILAVCGINDENLASLMVDQIHNPLFEKRLYCYRTGITSLFPKKLIGEIEQLFHEHFIQGNTFLATQHYERHCVACQRPLGQECCVCTGCNLVRYCDVNCAKQDESNHDKICRMDRFEILKLFLESVCEERNCQEIEVV